MTGTRLDIDGCRGERVNEEMERTRRTTIWVRSRSENRRRGNNQSHTDS